LDSEQVNQVCQWVYPWLDLKALNFHGVERALLIKNWFFYALLPSLAFAVLSLAGDMLTPVYALLSLLLLSGLVYLS
ncbi:hypothetical protein ABXT13_13685, partial [Staphylococcus caprae]|uniref:hypothetical protein n=1 Tax=Staphylococcus caprae TaxID=29380 RepID=UPI0033958BB7